MGVAFAGLALLTPIGWMRAQPTYTIRAGKALRVGLRDADRTLLARLLGRPTHDSARRLLYSVSHEEWSALPPGLAVEPETGALVGTPTMPGTYTLALAASDQTAHVAAVGDRFKLRVLPAM